MKKYLYGMRIPDVNIKKRLCDRIITRLHYVSGKPGKPRFIRMNERKACKEKKVHKEKYN